VNILVAICRDFGSIVVRVNIGAPSVSSGFVAKNRREIRDMVIRPAEHDHTE
jgi:hypothetical protein